MPGFDEGYDPSNDEEQEVGGFSAKEDSDAGELEFADDQKGLFENSIEQCLDSLNQGPITVDDFDDAISWLEQIVSDGQSSDDWAGFARRVSDLLKEFSSVRDDLEAGEQDELEQDDAKLKELKEGADELLKDLQKTV